MGIVKTLKKRYWADVIYQGGRPIPYGCGRAPVPEKAYAFFTDAELNKIHMEQAQFYEHLKEMIHR